jgi:hypothetical protein
MCRRKIWGQYTKIMLQLLQRQLALLQPTFEKSEQSRGVHFLAPVDILAHIGQRFRNRIEVLGTVKAGLFKMVEQALYLVRQGEPTM